MAVHHSVKIQVAKVTNRRPPSIKQHLEIRGIDDLVAVEIGTRISVRGERERAEAERDEAEARNTGGDRGVVHGFWRGN